MAKSPFSVFGTEPTLEQTGIRIDYGSFYFHIARAGGTNAKFSEAVRAKFRPFQRAVDLGEMDEKVSNRLTAEAFAETVVLGWGTPAPDPTKTDEENKEDGRFGDGFMIGADGVAIPFSIDAVNTMLTSLPDLTMDLIKESQKIANFRKVVATDDAKN